MSSKDKDSTWIQFIRAITSPLNVIVLILLILGELFWTVPGSGLQPETKSFVMQAALWLFAFVIINIIVMFWIDRVYGPGHLAIHHEEIRSETIDHTDKVLVASPIASTTEALRAFWKTDGKHINKANEKRLKAWMKENGCGRLPISFFLVDIDFERARDRAIQDLKIPMQLSDEG